jgi:ABC-type uncharacterized transport system ATPase subunit
VLPAEQGRLRHSALRLDGAAKPDRETLATTGLAAKARPGRQAEPRQKRWLEIGMVIVQQSSSCSSTEPVAGMTDEETEKTAQLWAVAEDRSVLVIEHDMDSCGASRTVTVLHEGSVLCEAMDQVQKDERVMEVYLGRSQDASHAWSPRCRARSFKLEIKGLGTSRTAKSQVLWDVSSVPAGGVICLMVEQGRPRC